MIDHDAVNGAYCCDRSVADSGRVHYNRVVVDALKGSLVPQDMAGANHAATMICGICVVIFIMTCSEICEYREEQKLEQHTTALVDKG